MAQSFSYPSSSTVTVSGIGNPTGLPVPTDAIYIAGENPGGNLEGLQTDASGNLKVTLATTTIDQQVNLTKVGGSAISEGQKTMATSLPVVLASDQSTLPVSAASLPLPTGSATAANQTSVQSAPGSSAAIALTVQGSAAGVAIPVSAAALPLPSGAATSALQTTGNTSLSSIDGKLATLGQKTMAGSTPIVIASDQSKITVTRATPTAGTVTQAAITIGTTGVRLTVSGSAPSATRSVLVVTPDAMSTATFYIGSSSVANSGASRGIQIVAGQTFTANNDAGDYYIISSTAAQTVYVMEQA